MSLGINWSTVQLLLLLHALDTSSLLQSLKLKKVRWRRAHTEMKWSHEFGVGKTMRPMIRKANQKSELKIHTSLSRSRPTVVGFVLFLVCRRVLGIVPWKKWVIRRRYLATYISRKLPSFAGKCQGPPDLWTSLLGVTMCDSCSGMLAISVVVRPDRNSLKTLLGLAGQIFKGH